MGKCIYIPKGKAQEYSPWAVNLHKGCSNDCTYCFLKRGKWAAQLGGLVPTLKKCLVNEDKAYQIFEKELAKYRDQILADGGLLFTFSSDPCLPATLRPHWRCISHAISQGVPVQVLTKMAGWLEHPDVQWALENGGELLKVGFTLTGRDDLEPFASPNRQRIETMRELHDRGIKTWASIEPIVDPQSSMAMIRASVDCCLHYKIGIMTGKKDYTSSAIRAFKDEVDKMALDVYWKKSLLKFIQKP